MRSLTRRGGGAMQPWSGGLQPMMTLLDDLRSEFDRFFSEAEGIMPAGIGGAQTTNFMPAVDIREKDNEYQITAEVPGIDPKDIEVRVEGNTLILRGERNEEHEEKGANFFRRERSFGSFSRAFTLPEAVDVDQVRARAKGGLLTISLPKRETGKASRVQIQSEEETGRPGRQLAGTTTGTTGTTTTGTMGTTPGMGTTTGQGSTGMTPGMGTTTGQGSTGGATGQGPIT